MFHENIKLKRKSENPDYGIFFFVTLKPNASPPPYGKITILTYTNRRRSDGVAVYFRQGISGQETGDI